MATSSNETGAPDWLHVPTESWGVENCGPYGATAVAAEYCGLKEVPKFSHWHWHWQHSWHPSHWNFIHPDLIMGIPTSPEQAYWVARKEEAEYMRSCGYAQVEAIGLPIVYVRRPPVSRRPGSLLVMPVNSLDYAFDERQFDEYAEQIDAIRTDFSTVVACIGPSYWREGSWIDTSRWVDTFQKRGITIVREPLVEDRNALLRICALFGTFEYVTTNSYSSQIAYGAYLGAKVSVYGKYADFKAEDFIDFPVYRETPQLLGPTVQNVSEKSMRKHLPGLFCHPREAKEQIEWGRREVGEDNRLSPKRLQSSLGWGWRNRLMWRLNGPVPSGPTQVGTPLEHYVQSLQEHQKQKEKTTELHRLQYFPGHCATTTTLLGSPLELTDAACFLFLYREIWERKLYHFHPETKTPFIIDGGANIGVSVIYFKRLYPHSRVLAFEPDPRIFKVLARNCEQFGLENVELFPEALWSSAGELEFKPEAELAGRVQPNGTGHGMKVPTRRLRDLLDRDVDLLKLDIEGSETEVLRDCASELYRVRNLFVEYHSYRNQPQTLDEISGILKAAGFRVYLESDQSIRQPFLWQPVSWGMDMRLNIFAYRMPHSRG
jgi:FkbM family methyltransferase